MADGYGWLLERCGDPSLREHAAHLDDDHHDDGCLACRDHDGCSHTDHEIGDGQ